MNNLNKKFISLTNNMNNSKLNTLLFSDIKQQSKPQFKYYLIITVILKKY